MTPPFDSEPTSQVVKSVRTARRSASDYGLGQGYSVWTEVKLLNAAAASIWSLQGVLKHPLSTLIGGAFFSAGLDLCSAAAEVKP